jgi:hypothetical protein
LVTHTHRPVMVVSPRIDAFAGRRVFVLQGAGDLYGVRPKLFQLERLEHAFINSGFELQARPTLLAALPKPPF